MAISVSVRLEDDGPVVCHRADAAHRDQLREAGERLRAASHPGVVLLRRSRPLEDGWELVTAHGGHAPTPSRVATAGRLAAIGAHVAATLADLHQRGVVHGRLSTGRVLVGSHGAVVLCGFGPAAGDATPADDVAGLGALLESLADRLEGERAPTGDLGALRAVARRARTHPASRRPSARRLAEELSAVASGSVREGGRSAGARRVGVAGAVAALVVLLSTAVGREASGGGPQRPGPTTTATTTSAPTTTAAMVREVRCAARRDLPVDAATCGHDVVVDAGGGAVAVVVDGHRSVVGAAGDEVVVADWGCAGAPRPALLRPGTGEVLVFSAPAADGSRRVAAAGRVEGARGLTTTTDRAGCPQVLVRLRDGATVPLEPGG